MKKKTLIITSCVVGGLVGIGLLTRFLLKEEDEQQPSGEGEAPPQVPDNSLTARRTIPEKRPDDVVKRRPETYRLIPKHRALPPPTKPAVKRKPDRVVVPPVKKRTISPRRIKVRKHIPAPVRDEFPLRLGSRGGRVERLQVWLMRNYGLFGKINGTFDRQTAAMVKKHLKRDVVDEQTYRRFRMGKHVTEQVIIR